MCICADYKGYTVYSDGRVWRPTQVRMRKDGVSRKIKGGWVATRVRNADKGAGGGYVYIDLWVDHKAEHWLLHRLVASLFVSNPLNAKQVNHKDGNRGNNSADNLEWMSCSQNQKHAYEILGRARKKGKLTDAQISEVYNLRNISKLPLTVIGQQFGISFQSVSRIALGGSFVTRKEVLHHA